MLDLARGQRRHPRLSQLKEKSNESSAKSLCPGGDPGLQCLVDSEFEDTKQVSPMVIQSSERGHYYDARDRPGSSYLYIGQKHQLCREEVAQLIAHLTNWLAKGQLTDDALDERIGIAGFAAYSVGSALGDFHPKRDATYHEVLTNDETLKTWRAKYLEYKAWSESTDPDCPLGLVMSI
jgi:hypothetical protein